MMGLIGYALLLWVAFVLDDGALRAIVVVWLIIEAMLFLINVGRELPDE